MGKVELVYVKPSWFVFKKIIYMVFWDILGFKLWYYSQKAH